MKFCQKIIALRKSSAMSQETLAEQLSVSRQAISKWESGESMPDIDNLVKLARIFNVSLDKLFQDNACSDLPTKINHLSDEAIDFLLKAKANTYAGNILKAIKSHLPSSRPHSHDLQYAEGVYKYIDTYLGGENFIGEEALFINNKPVWGMNYYGAELNDRFSGDFLKSALRTGTRALPYRGQNLFSSGDYTYVNEVTGDFGHFSGNETIYCKAEKVYECHYFGGLIS